MLLSQGSASAAYSDIPNQLPDAPSQYINLAIGGSDPGNGYGANLTTSTLKVYAKDNLSKGIYFDLIDRRANPSISCSGYGIRVHVLRTDGNENLTGAEVDYIDFYPNACTGQAGYTGFSMVIPAGALTQSVRPTSAAEGIYTVGLAFEIFDTDGNLVNTATLLPKMSGAGRMAYMPGQRVTVYPSLTQEFDHRISFKFRPPCNIAPNSSYRLSWRDDDFVPAPSSVKDPLDSDPVGSPDGTVAQWDSPRARIYEYDRTGAFVGSYVGGSTIYGNDGVGQATVTMQPGNKYELVFESVDGGNAISLDYPPYDMGDFYLPCPPPPPPPQPPLITVDGVSTCGSVYGWAFDPDNSGASISVHIYKGGPAGGGGTMVGNISADQPRGDVNAAYGIAGNHGFNFVIPPGDRDGADKTYYVYAIDSNGTDNTGADPYFRPGYSGGTNPITMTGCGPFKLVPSVSGEALRPNDESPTQFCGTVRVTAEYSGWAGGGSPANGVPADARYRFEKDGVVVSGPTPYAGNNGNSRFIDSSQEYCIGVSGYILGNKYCLILSISPTDGLIDRNGNVISSSGAANGTNLCDEVVNLPYMRVYSGDTAAGGGFDDANCVRTASKIKTYLHPIAEQQPNNRSGSGGQLAAFALDTISGFTSASNRTVAPQLPRGLTFSNTDPITNSAANDPVLGGSVAGKGWCAPDYFNKTQYPNGSAQKTISSSTADIDIRTLGSPSLQKQTRLDISGGKVTLMGHGPNDGLPQNDTSPNFALNKRQVLYVDGDVFIRGNIVYATDYSGGVNTIPNFALIVRGDIYIDNDVTQLDGLYVAQPLDNNADGDYLDAGERQGRIYTCAVENAAPTPARSAVTDPNALYAQCGGDVAGPNRTLRINGAAVANRVIMNRTYRTLRDSRYQELASTSNAAEIFNLAPEIYLAPPFFKPSGTLTGGKYDYIATLAPIL